MRGYIHSLQSMGAVDGPGIRYCIFVQGCPLRCMYCHNPDTWVIPGKEYYAEDGNTGDRAENENRIKCNEYSVEELVAKILRYKPYFANGGGVTVSGGEPLTQVEFVTELFEALHKEGINTCLDTSGHMTKECYETGNRLTSAAEAALKRLFSVTDLCICDIKFTSDEAYGGCAGGSLVKVEGFLEKAAESNVPLWVRHVVVPGYTDTEEEVTRMVSIAQKYKTLRKIELLPFHKLCVPKYEALKIPFRCADIPECSAETIKKLSVLLPENY